METFKCECCQLDHPNTLRPSMFDEYVQPKLCRMCIEHRGTPAQRVKDHDKELRWRLDGARKAARDMEHRTKDMHQKMVAAYESRDRLLGMLNDLTFSHCPDGKGGCVCRAKECDVLPLVEDSWVRSRLSDYRRRNVA